MPGNLELYSIKADSLSSEPRPLIEQLRDAFYDAGLDPPDGPIHTDGRVHRFAASNKAGDDAGWYVIYGDGIPAGVIGNWRTGETHNFRAQLSRSLTPAEEFAVKARIENARAMRDAERARKHEQAAATVAEIWDAASLAAAEHPYLERKRVQPHGARIGGDGRLILPLYNSSGAISSLQYIDGTGRKTYHPGGAVGGCFYMMGDADGHESIYIAEGFATAATICETVHAPTVVAYSANNLPSVTAHLREQFPAAELIIVADNDKSGTGQMYASQASAKHGARVIVIPIEGMDANDYALSGNDLATLLAPVSDGWLISDTELCSQPAPIKWLIKGWIQDNALIMAHGPSGVGKTFVVLDWALSIAYLDQWAGKRTTCGTVAYLAGEGHHGIRSRVAAWKQVHAGAGSGRFFLSRGACDLNTAAGLQSAMSELRRLPEPPRLVVVDTLHRFMTGDENSAQDAKTMIDACALIQREFSCSVLLVHHTGVSEEAQTRARGSSAWRGALENEISIRPESGGICIKQEKVKDAERLDPLFFNLETVEIDGWFDDEDEPVKSAVVSFTEKPKKDDKKASVDADRIEGMWNFSGCEERNGKPFLTFAAMKRYLLEMEGLSESSARGQLRKAGERESFLKRVIRVGTLFDCGDGYIVVDDDLITRLFLRKK